MIEKQNNQELMSEDEIDEDIEEDEEYEQDDEDDEEYEQDDEDDEEYYEDDEIEEYEDERLNLKKVAHDGLVTDNPLFMQFLGLCPALAVTTGVINGVGMGILAGIVLILSNILIALLCRFIPERMRVAFYLLVISILVLAVEMLIWAYMPEFSMSLGIFVPLIVVNGIILSRAETAASHGLLHAGLDGVFTALGFAVALFLVSAVREILGSGMFAGVQIFPQEYAADMLVSPPGAFIIIGVLIAAFRYIISKRKMEADE